MPSQISAVLSDFVQKHAATLAPSPSGITATSLADDRLMLTGVVLDQDCSAARQAVSASSFPSLFFDASSVQVLRPGRAAAVTANLTGLYSAAFMAG